MSDDALALTLARENPMHLLVLSAHAVAALLIGPREWRWLRTWAACQLGVIAAFGVWLAAIVRNLGSYTNDLVSAPPLWAMLWRSSNTFMLGFNDGRGVARLLAPALIALAGIGVAWLLSRRRQASQRSAVFLLSYLLAPFVLV